MILLSKSDRVIQIQLLESLIHEVLYRAYLTLGQPHEPCEYTRDLHSHEEEIDGTGGNGLRHSTVVLADPSIRVRMIRVVGK